MNDTAERGVALVKSFNGKLTRNETDFQNLLQVKNFKMRKETKKDFCSLVLSYNVFPLFSVPGAKEVGV